MKNEESGEELVSKIASSGCPNDEALRAAGVYYIYGEIKEGGLIDVQQDILLKHYLGQKEWKRDLTFIINSIGGSVDEANALLDIWDNVHMDINTVGLGQCSSAAACLLAAGTPGKRRIGKSTMVMIHCYQWGATGKHHELVAHRKVQNNTYEQEIQFWMKHSKYTNRKDVEKHLLRHEDTWLTAKEAKLHGIVDIIGDSIL